MGIEEQIENSHLLTDIFGRWPSFHDAEVMRIVLDRKSNPEKYRPNLLASIYVFQGTGEIDEKGYYRLKHKTVVDLKFNGVDELVLEDFGLQNVLGDLSIVNAPDRRANRAGFRVTFHQCYGVAVGFWCGSICVQAVAPYIPDDSR